MVPTMKNLNAGFRGWLGAMTLVVTSVFVSASPVIAGQGYEVYKCVAGGKVLYASKPTSGQCIRLYLPDISSAPRDRSQPAETNGRRAREDQMEPDLPDIQDSATETRNQFSTGPSQGADGDGWPRQLAMPGGPVLTEWGAGYVDPELETFFAKAEDGLVDTRTQRFYPITQLRPR